MDDMMLSDALLNLLKTVDTPTVCNAIEVAQGQRGFDNFTKRTMLASDTAAASMVGFARTAKIAGRTPPNAGADVIRSRRMAYFEHMATGGTPRLAVVEDVDGDNAVSAWWGEVHTAVHKGLGLAGAVTNGVMRDLGDLEPGFPVLAGSIGPSHAFVHVRDIACTVSIFGMQVHDGDLVHADRHGALVIPRQVIPELHSAIEKLLKTEQLILGPARAEGFTIDKLKDAWAEFEQART